jgi:hypothetical protein
MGRWVNKLGDAANSPSGFYPLYATLAACVLLSLIGLPCLHAIRRRENIESAHSVREMSVVENDQ